ncbi:MAG: efflux RND transporter periplasmic adaptor subunit [Patescibacteria group bacterium]|jgi:HlyD family secretion protein
MKKIIKSKIVWVIIIILVIAVGAYLKFGPKAKSVEYVTTEVKSGDIKQTVSATGKIKSASEIELNFKNTGKLAILNVKVGDTVTANQILAQLKATDLSIQVSSAQADLKEAQANLDKLKAGATTQDVTVSEAAVEKAQTDLANAQNDLVSTEDTYKQALVNERGSILVDIDSALTKSSIALQEVYDTLHFKGTSDNFSATNMGLEIKVNTGYDLASEKLDQTESVYNQTKLDPNNDDAIDSLIEESLVTVHNVSALLNDLSDLLNYVLVNTVLTQTELDTLKTTINTQRTTIDSSSSAVQTSKEDLADARLNYQTKVDAAQDAISVAEKNLAKAQADLNFKEAPARPEDITLYEARLNRARAELNLAQDKYEETIIRAPINGVITDINFNVGEQTNLSEPVIKMLAVENYEIEVDIPESDIVKISAGDKVEITLDAFSSNDIFQGVITTINPAQTEIQDVIYYRVTVTFQEDQPEPVSALMDKIKPGMTANVTVNTAFVKDVLIIPQRAVKDEGDKAVVQILENNQPKSVEVILGLKGDEGLVEVKSGLKIGDQVITFIREVKK